MKHTVFEVELKNGAKGLFIDVPGATVMSFEFDLRAGYYLVDRDKWEAPHIMEHVMLGANSRFKHARRFNAEFQKNGAYANASTSSYSIQYVAECADFEWERILELMMLSISKPLFLESEFKAEWGNVRDELSGYLNNHFRELSLRMQEKFGLLVMTDHQRLEVMKNVTNQDIIDHYRATHGTENIRFIIAGRIRGRKSGIIDLLENGMRLKKGERFELPDEQAVAMNTPLYVHNETVNNMHFFIDMFASDRLAQWERDALGLLNTMLTATLHSLILGEARERGLVYHMGSHHSTYKQATGWWFGAQVVPENAQPLMGIIVEQLGKVLAGHVKTSDVDAAKQYSLGRFQRGAQTVAGLSQIYGAEYFFDDTIESYQRMPIRIQALGKSQLIEVARRMFAEKVWGLGVLGSCGEDLTHQLHGQAAELWEKYGTLSE